MLNNDEYRNEQMINKNNISLYRAKIVYVADPDEWYGEDKIVCRVWDISWRSSAPIVRIAFLSIDDKIEYRDFEMDTIKKSWEEAIKLYESIPETIDFKWLRDNGFERF